MKKVNEKMRLANLMKKDYLIEGRLKDENVNLIA